MFLGYQVEVYCYQLSDNNNHNSIAASTLLGFDLRPSWVPNSQHSQRILPRGEILEFILLFLHHSYSGKIIGRPQFRRVR